MSAPILSIICTVHDSEATLNRMLDSILSEEMSADDYEIIACDECSTDSSLSLLHQFVHDHPDIHMSILCSDLNGSHSDVDARQYGIAQASGEWIRFLDSVDTLDNQGCKKFLEYIASCNTPKVMIKSEIAQVDSDHQFLQYLPTNTTVIYGNFYNRLFMNYHGISFDTNMKFFNDMYFNSCFFAKVFYFGDPARDLGYINECTYNWTYDYSNELLEECRGHVELYLIDDWIKGSFIPFEKYLHIWPVPNVDLFKNRICQTTCELYYYYENGIFRQALDHIDLDVISHAEDSIKSYFQLLDTMCRNVFKNDMIEMLYSAPDIFFQEYYHVSATNNYFVPEHSYKEFIEMACESL